MSSAEGPYPALSDPDAVPVDPPAARSVHRLDEQFVLLTPPESVNYREACPPYDLVDAVRYASRADGVSQVVYLRGQNPVFDLRSQPGAYEFGGWWPKG